MFVFWFPLKAGYGEGQGGSYKVCAKTRVAVVTGAVLVTDGSLMKVRVACHC